MVGNQNECKGQVHVRMAQKVQQASIRVIIANGEREDNLTDLTERRSETPHTEFLPAKLSEYLDGHCCLY